MTNINWTNITVRLGDLKAWPDNPRQSTKAQAKKLLQSFDEFGQVETIAVSPELEVYNGHQRLSALMTIHGKDYQIDARQASRALTEQERKKLTIFLHAGATGSWDWDTLSGWDASEMISWGLDDTTLKEWKHDISGLGEMLKSEKQEPVDAEPQIDKAEELRAKWGVESGQLWQLGEHRLLCGDCTYPEIVERLLGGEKADMILTDPPYALFGNSTGVSGVTDDKMTAPFFREIFKRAKEFTKPFAHIYVCCDWHSAFALRQAGVDVGLSEKNLIIWDKGDGGVGAMYQQCYELIWFFANSPKSSALGGHITGERTVNGIPNIWRVGRESSKREHGAQKPIELFSIPVTYGVDEDGIVMDLFLGSGTTMVACQNLSRKCRAIEISPAYCAVILERMSTAFPEIKIEQL